MKLRFEPVRRLCQEAVSNEVAPGFVVLVAEAGQIQFHEAFGWRQLVPRQLPAFPDTVYDVASLTKAVVTSVLAMRAVASGVVSLDEPVVRRLPEFEGPGREAITVRHLLSHSSGLPAYRPFWRQATDADSERWAISLAAAREPLEYSPGTMSIYSDLGFILLGWLLERATEQRLDALAAREIFEPLGLAGAATFVNLAESDGRARLLAERSVAATQQCPERGRIVLGEVDDLNAYAMGGIAGHAGLFADATALSTIAGALVSAWNGSDAPGGRPPLVARDVVREFWSPARVPGSVWRLGWDGPSAQRSQAGARISRAAVGHLGFTGCSLWIDPARATWIVLLANRVHPAVPQHDRFRAFRPALHDAALEALGCDNAAAV